MSKINVNLNLVLAQKKIKGMDLAKAVGITQQNISLIRTGKIKGIRFDTLSAICHYIGCQPGDLLTYEQD